MFTHYKYYNFCKGWMPPCSQCSHIRSTGGIIIFVYRMDVTDMCSQCSHRSIIIFVKDGSHRVHNVHILKIFVNDGCHCVHDVHTL